MKTVFVINPCAGQGKGIDKLKEKIKAASEKTGQQVGFYVTKQPGDAELFTKTFCEETKGVMEGRIIACGGDGTFNEVINGVYGYEHVSVGVIPIGTGNDFVRNFPEAGDFMNPEAQLLGSDESCDVIKYWGMIDGVQQTRYCANMFNIGFDCNVVDMAAKLKEYPMVAGSFAYLLAVGVTFVKKKGAKLRVELDGEVIEDGQVLLTALANGGFCGGGINSAPVASIRDGKMDVNIIYNVTRREFLGKFPHYAKGTYMDLDGIEKIIHTQVCQTAKITPLDGEMRLCVDGEIVDAGEIEFAVEPLALKFVVPASL